MKEIELFELDALENIAIVKEPAIEIDFLCFSKDKKYTFTVEDKRILTGPFMVPDMRIPRYDENGELYYVFFSKDTVERIAYDFMSNDKIHAFNLEHEEDTNKLTLIESWLKTTDEDKSAALGIEAPIGTWFGSVKVNDDEIWNDIKNGKYNGFSIAGVFTKNKEKVVEPDYITEEEYKSILSGIKKLLSSNESI
jgi:hypothetical protein